MSTSDIYDVFLTSTSDLTLPALSNKLPRTVSGNRAAPKFDLNNGLNTEIHFSKKALESSARGSTNSMSPWLPSNSGSGPFSMISKREGKFHFRGYSVQIVGSFAEKKGLQWNFMFGMLPKVVSLQ